MNKRYPLLLIVALMCTSGTSLTQSIANSRPDAATVLTSADGKYTSSSGAFSSFAPFGGSRMLVQKKAFNVIFSFDSPTVANRFGMQTGGDYFNSARGPKAWKIYGSNDYVPSADRKTDDTAANDAANWIELYSVEEETEWDDSGEYRYYEFPNPTPYRSYKIEVSDNNGESYTQWQYIEYLYEPETSIWVAGNPSEFSDGTLPAPAFGYYAFPSELPVVYKSYNEYKNENETIISRCTGYTFYLQNDNGDWVTEESGNGCEFTLTKNPKVNAKLVWNYENEYLVSVSADICGTVSTAGDYIAHGERFEVKATPNDGYRFARWCEDVPPGLEETNPLKLNITAPIAIRALFLPENAASPVQYVSPDGSDDNNGFTAESARQSLSNAVAFVSQFGETPSQVHVLEGWHPTKSPIRLDGPITVSGAGGDLSRTIVSNSVKTGWQTSHNQRVFEMNHPGAVVSNLTISGGLGLQVSGANVQFFNGGTVAGCVIENGFGDGWFSEGAAFNIITGRVTRCIIRNNGTNLRGHALGSAASIGTTFYKRPIGDALVDNCLFINNYCGDKSTADNLIWVGNGGKIINCTIVGSRMALTNEALFAEANLLRVESPGYAANCVAIGATDYDGNSITMNRPITWNDTNTIKACAVDNIASEDAAIGTGILRLVRKEDFKNYSAGDYRPAVFSALYNTGLPIEAGTIGTIDLSGKARVVGKSIDIGCYETQVSAGMRIRLR